jgi:hypothetical protein
MTRSRYVRMASGRTRGLPHEEFWRGFTGLLLDGVRFTAAGFIGGGRSAPPAELHGAHMTAALPALPTPRLPLCPASRPPQASPSPPPCCPCLTVLSMLCLATASLVRGAGGQARGSSSRGGVGAKQQAAASGRSRMAARGAITPLHVGASTGDVRRLRAALQQLTPQEGGAPPSALLDAGDHRCVWR